MFAQSNSKILNVFDYLSYAFILLNVALVPLFIDPRVYNFYIIPKEYVFMGLVLLNVLLFAAKIVLSKQVSIRKSVLDVPLLIVLGLALLSALFSSNLYDSFLGRAEYFVINFVFIFFLAVFYFVLTNHITTAERWRGVMDILLGAGAAVSLLFILKTVFKLNLPWIGQVWNTVDPANSSFGLWLAVIFILSAGLLIKKKLGVSRALFYFFVMILSFIPFLLMGFKFLWWILLVGLILLLLLGASNIKEARVGWLSVLFSILILVSVFIIFGSPKSLQSILPAEVSLGAKSSWVVAKDTVFSGAKNFLLGSGLGTFAADFSRFRTADFNYDQVAWSLRFNQPFNAFFALLSESGVALTLGLVFVFLFVIGHVLSSWFRGRGSENGISLGLRLGRTNIHFDVFLAAIAWIILWVGMAFNFYSVSLWALWGLFLGLIMAGLSLIGDNVIKEKSWTLEDTPQYNLAFSFSLIIVMAVIVMMGILGVRFYWADMIYVKALQSADYATAESALSKALVLRQNSDVYHVAMAKVYLMRAGELSKGASPDVKAVADMVARAVNEAKIATDISPKSVGIWENLATMYENAALLVPEAGEWALKSLNTAIELEPTNVTLYLRMGNNYMAANNAAKAIEYYKKAMDLKKDYAAAYVGLSGAYEANKQINEAVDAYRNILPLGSQNPEILFNFGRLLYNRNEKDDRDNAEKLWLETVKAQPNYSNALYSLGLLYEVEGDKARALQYYYRVKDLNPDNGDIVAKIKSLVGGKTSLEAESATSTSAR